MINVNGILNKTSLITQGKKCEINKSYQNDEYNELHKILVLFWQEEH